MAKDLTHDALPLARGIHARMIQAGLTQKSLALKAGVNETYVRDIFKGASRNPTVSKLEKIAAALGCRLEDLSSVPRTLDQAESDAQLADRADEEAMLRMFRDMERPMRQRLFDLLKANVAFLRGDTGKSDVG